MTRSGDFLRVLSGSALLFGLFAFSALTKPIYSKDDFRIDFSGYLQEQALHSPDFFGASFDLSQTRWRSALDFNFGKALSAELSQTLEASAGSALDNPFYVLSSEMKPPTYFKWDKRLIDDEEMWLEFSIYRAWLAYENDRIKAIIGRQRIAFGSAYFYSPMDIFNPISPLSLEPLERVGVDGASLEIDFNPTSYLTLAYGAGEILDQSRFATYFKTTVKSYDLHFLAARIFTDYILGFAFSGYLKEGGLYGEATYTMPEDQDNFFRGTIGYQYSFKNSLVLTAEYYHNDGVISGLEMTNPASFLSTQNGLITINRNFLALSTGFDLTPLIRFSSAVMYDLDAGSFFIGPSFTYSAPHSITASAGTQLFDGSKNTDFGFLPNFLWARIRWDY